MCSPSFTLEVCADSVDSALIAQQAGAARVEFCDNLSEGGTTPSMAQIATVTGLLAIKVYVLIRPRGGDFLYSDTEFDIMKSDIRYCGTAGCHGVVLGMLNANGRVDAERCGELIAIARSMGMGVTFHRAFDRCENMDASLETVIQLGCERILTSGGKNTALEGIPVIRHLTEKAGGRISIMPGAGVSPNNAAEIVQRTGVQELHGTFRSCYPSKMIYKNNALNGNDEYSRRYADKMKIAQTLSLFTTK